MLSVFNIGVLSGSILPSALMYMVLPVCANWTLNAGVLKDLVSLILVLTRVRRINVANTRTDFALTPLPHVYYV